MEARAARQRIVPVLGVLLTFPLSCFGDSVRTYGGQYDLRIPADTEDSRGWMNDAVVDVPDHLAICDVDVRISLTHTKAFDLRIFLQSPAGARICLNTYNPFSEYFEGENYTQTVFDDEAEIPINQGQPPFTGRFRPREDRLAAFDGEDCFGPWRLQIYDAFYMDTGNLNSFELFITVIEPATLSLLQPNGGEVLTAGSTCTISWASTGSVGNVLPEYSIDNGATWAPVNASDTGQAGSYDWQVPAVDSNQCLVRVSDANNPTLCDTSDSLFAIAPAMVAVPDVVGMAQAEAASAIISAGLVVGSVTQDCDDTVPAGCVLGQNPPAGAMLAVNSAVDLVVSHSSPRTVRPPLVFTLGATNVTSTTATLWASVLDDGGEPCQYNFSYWTSTFCGGFAWSDDSDCRSTGQCFSIEVTGLAPGTYYFQGEARNSAGPTVWANPQSFIIIKPFRRSGSGTEDDPYIITSVYELQQVGNDPNAWYELGSDIDASDTNNWDSGYGFTPIGCYTAPFEGIFDGKQHVITRLHISRLGKCVGLFGYTGEQSRIRNVGLADVTVAGHACVGGLVGFNSGAIEACYVNGNISGSTQVGGLVGTNYGLITNCYSTASVSGGDPCESGNFIAGLVGRSPDGVLKNCFSTGRVSGKHCGGLAAVCGGECTGCFWDIETSGQPTSACGIGKTTAEMQTWATFDAAGWSAKGGWTLCEHVDYPKLAWQIRPGDEFCPDGVDMVDFALFAARWKAGKRDASGDGGDSADFNQSGTVNATDLEILTSSWLTGGK